MAEQFDEAAPVIDETEVTVAPELYGYTDEGDGFFSRPGAGGSVVFVLGLLAPSTDPDIEGEEELHIAVAGFYRPTRAEAKESAA